MDFFSLDKGGILTYWYGPAAGARVGPLPYDHHHLASGNNYSLQTKATSGNSQTSRTAASCASTRTTTRASTTTIATRASVKELDSSTRNNFHCDLGLWINGPSHKRGTKKFIKEKVWKLLRMMPFFRDKKIILKLIWMLFQCQWNNTMAFSWKHRSVLLQKCCLLYLVPLYSKSFSSCRERRLALEGVCLPDSSCPIKTKIIVMILWPISVQEAELYSKSKKARAVWTYILICIPSISAIFTSFISYTLVFYAVLDGLMWIIYKLCKTKIANMSLCICAFLFWVLPV